MIGIALILAAEPVPQTMLATADEANAAYVQCLFATSRAAMSAHLSAEAFERKLGSACIPEEDAVVRAGTAVLLRRGEPNSSSSAKRVAEEARRSVVESYRQALALQH